MKLAIIIPISSKNELLVKIQTESIQSLFDTLDPNYKYRLTIIENNGSPIYAEKFKNNLQAIKKQNTNVQIDYFVSKERFNLSALYNIGIERSNDFDGINKHEYYIFANSDLIYKPNWLKCLRLFTEDNIARVLPSSTFNTAQYKVNTKNNVKSNNGFRIEPEINKTEYLINIDAPGWLYILPSWVLEKVGLWNEKLPGWFQDWEYNRRLLRKGYKTLWDYNTTVDHLDGQTFKAIKDSKEFHRLTTEGQAIWKEVLNVA